MHRLPTIIATAAATLAVAPAAHAATLGDWNLPEQRAVAAAGVLPRLSDGRLHGEQPLTRPEMSAAFAALAARTEPVPATVSTSTAARVSVTGFDARLVHQLGLSDVAEHVQAEARRVGLRPPRTFGTEVVARYLGLRDNHPAADDALELYPWDPITRAEAAHSLATVLQFGGWEAADARAQLSAFTLPSYSPAVRAALRVAVSKIGMPYIWGGETDRASSYYGYQAHGGYDCSGFVWRVFKLSGNPAGRAIGGRTAAQMAGEIPKQARIRLADVRPGDLLFFGPASFGSRATHASIVHVGIALSEHWMIHSSAQGVYVSSLDDPWRRDEFAWARRVL
jgi:cell wall-associated NlpC family hydrolase